ncbi:MAG: hypothetical protein JSW66_03460 [Phycisphaerales bacterium]|nr:MAG: hypothetical protein JSW66_03460 [Phycisphaerales bacterium]
MKKLVLVLVCVLPLLTSQAKVITVDDDGPADFRTIPAAINASGDGDTIIVKAGTYDQRISFDNKAVTLTSEDPNDPNVVQATIITAASGHSVTFDLQEGNGSVLTGFTITGRGIHCYGTSPTLSKNVITDCANYGIEGANNAAPIIADNVIQSSVLAGIIYCNGPITGNVISENKGGLAYCDGPITNNVISNNSDLDLGRGAGLSFCDGPITANVIAYNYATYKGGACYECPGRIADNLIIANRSIIAGGGLCNCRGQIINNIIAGNRSDNGGGLFSCTRVYYNTIVGNAARENGGGLSQCPGYVNSNIIAFNRAGSVGGIYGASISSFNALWSNEGGNFGGGGVVGPGDVVVNPLFVTDGLWDPNGTPDQSDDFWVDGDYHLKSEAGHWSPAENRWVSDTQTSPCIDAGDPNADWTAELWPHGRRINLGVYGGTPQASMSLLQAGSAADLNPDVNDVNDWVDYTDVAFFAKQWLSTEGPLAEDINRDGIVDFTDFSILLSHWRPQPPPPPPPDPDPLTWAAAPGALSRTAIAMTATVAVSTDGSGVEYYFECITAGGHDSGWQSEPAYTDAGLAPGTSYAYRTKARNEANRVETAYSETRSARTLAPDTTPPEPDPAAWQTQPYVLPPAAIRMVAETASDESGVEYYFACTSNPAYSSDWQDSPVYQAGSLLRGFYSFVVRVRDKSSNHNTTGDSAQITVDLQPPTPDPLQWQSVPRQTYGGGGTFDYWAEMSAVEATDTDGGIEYYFECTTDSGFSSGWQSSRTYRVRVGRRGQGHRFRVKARDAYGNETAFSSTLPAG